MKQKIKAGILFMLFAVPGALVYVFSSIILMFQGLDERSFQQINSSYLFGLAFIGGIMTLIGLQKFREWLYIFVFLSFPLALLIAGYIVPIILKFIGPLFVYPSLVLILVVIPYFIYKSVRNYYEPLKDTRNI